MSERLFSESCESQCQCDAKNNKYQMINLFHAAGFIQDLPLKLNLKGNEKASTSSTTSWQTTDIKLKNQL